MLQQMDWTVLASWSKYKKKTLCFVCSFQIEGMECSLGIVICNYSVRSPTLSNYRQNGTLNASNGSFGILMDREAFVSWTILPGPEMAKRKMTENKIRQNVHTLITTWTHIDVHAGLHGPWRYTCMYIKRTTADHLLKLLKKITGRVMHQRLGLCSPTWELSTYNLSWCTWKQ